MTDLTINEAVVIRILNSAATIYGDLPIERPKEASEFAAALDAVIEIVRARSIHRKKAGLSPKITNTATKEKGSAKAATLPSRVTENLRKGNTMNSATNITPTATTPSLIENQIGEHISAIAEHDRLFQLKDWGLMDDISVRNALGRVQDALITICQTRPVNSSDKKLRQAYLTASLSEALFDDRNLIDRAVNALLEFDHEDEVGLNRKHQSSHS